MGFRSHSVTVRYTLKATKEQAADLLDLVRLEIEQKRAKDELALLTSGVETEALRERQRALAAEFIDSRNELESIELELSRAETDLNLVESRIARDTERLAASTSGRDAQGLQAELESLAARKSDLEDFELSILERKETAKAKFDEVAQAKAAIDTELANAEDGVEQAIIKLRSGLEIQGNDHARLLARLPAELASAYEKKAARGVAAGRLIGRQCGACQITITATDFDAISSQSADELPTCPECQAFLVRG